MNKRIVGIIIIVIVLAIVGARFITPEDSWICQDGAWVPHGTPSTPVPTSTCANLAKPGPAINNVVFQCPNNFSIRAIFYKRAVDLALSDGRQLRLPQTISGSGVRYANPDESVVFWNKGDAAFLEENGTTTIDNCVVKK